MGLDEQYAEAEQWVAHSMQLHQVRLQPAAMQVYI
jgi:hypothetical protein